jgi:hypothetical protein
MAEQANNAVEIGYASSRKTGLIQIIHNGLNNSLLTPHHAMPDDISKYIIIAFVLVFGALAWRAWQVKQASPAWPSVEGEILGSRVYARNETGDQSGTPTHDWLTEVRYSYTVNGKDYTGNRLRAFGLNHFDKDQAMKEILPFQAGTHVKVYYDPEKPSNSVLIPG